MAAVMYPENEEEIAFNNETERTMYESLRDQLSDQYCVFYSLKWNFIDHEDRNRQKDGECDFLVFDPEYGYIVIEVKGGDGIIIDDNKWTLHFNSNAPDRLLKESPYEQASKNMRYFKNYYEDYNRTFYSGIFGYAVAFPRFVVPDDLSALCKKEWTIDKNDMNNLSDRIHQIFHDWKNGRTRNTQFTPDASDRFKNTVNTCIVMSAAAGALIEERKREFAKIDFVQDSILELLHNYSKVQIIGGAGTGKTYIAMKKAIRDAKLNKSVLYLCSDNKELLNFVEVQVNKKVKGNVEFKTYEDLIVGTIGREAYDNAPVQYKYNHEYKECFDLINVDEIDKYDSIIVDEAQDFDEDMGCTTCLFLKDSTSDSSLYVFYDVDQNLYANDPKTAFLIDTKPYLLKYNIRNTGEIYEYAKRETGLGKDTVSSEIQGAEPVIRPNNTPQQTIKELNGILRDLSDGGVSNDSIVILSNDSYENSILANEKTIYNYNICHNKGLEEIGTQEICYRTVEEFKGLEANVVIYLEEDGPTIDRDDRYKKLEYTACTRARYCLYILQTICDNRL